MRLIIAVVASLVVTAAQGATVVSTAHYQHELFLNCSSSFCSGDFPKPGANHQLNLTRANCELIGQSGSTFALGLVELLSSSGGHILYEWLPANLSAPDGHHLINQEIDMQVAASQHVNVTLYLTSGGTAAPAICTLTGTLDTLQ
jgi:hypothetical protein